MKTPELHDFMNDTYYLKVNHPKWAQFRAYLSTQIIFGMPVLFYCFIYPPALFCIWVLTSLLSGFVAQVPFIAGLSRYSNLDTYNAIASAIKSDIMSVALLPVSIPYSFFANDFVSGIIWLLVYLAFISFFFVAIYAFIKFVFGFYKILWRLFV